MISGERTSKGQALPEMIPCVMRSSVSVAVEDPSWEYCLLCAWRHMVTITLKIFTLRKTIMFMRLIE